MAVCLQNEVRSYKTHGLEDVVLARFALVFWGTEVSLTGEGGSAQAWGVGLGISKLGKECWCWAGSPRGEKWCLSAPLFLEGSSMIPVSQDHVLR